MAGKKKQAQLTPEEKLQQALVPEAEQPYKVPANWCWLHLLYSFINCTDSNKKIKQKEYLKEGILPIVDQGKDLIGGFTNNKELAFKGDLPVIIFGDHTRCVKYVDFNFVQGADGVKVLKPQIFYNEKLFYYALKNIDIKNLGYRRHFPTFDQYFVPLPPLAEQQRIVERIESLFAKLDEAKEKLQNVLDGFETRKAAILHKAFTGELTANWRKQHGISMDSWEEKKLGKIVKNIKDKYEPMLNNKKCIKYIGLEHIEKNNGIIGFGSSDDVKSLKTIFELGDILYGKLRPYLNKHDIAKFSGICSTDILVYRAEDFNTAKFMNYFMNTEKFIFYTVSNSKGINLPRISEKEVSGILVNVPTLSEQSEIVRIIDGLFAKEQQAKELAENVLAKIALIKKAILARAFRGELGTNNLADEPAVELLKRML